MPSRPLSVVFHRLRSAAERDGTGATDGELLTRLLTHRDDDALAALVERHAPMVWGVCRRVLRHPHDAEDAFQATFLVLVRKAGTVRSRELLANWLYGVAHQTAVRMRATAAKRGWREVQMDVMLEPAVAEVRDEELLSRLDEELKRLPERCRALIVLCDLEGRTRKEVARQLGCPEGTVASGLVRARELLAKRLTRRGLAVSGGSLAVTLSHSMASADVPASVVTSAINVATLLTAGKAAGVISGPVATLTQGVLKTMFLKKLLTTAVAVLALGVAVILGGSLAVGQTEGKPAVGKDVKAPVAEKPMKPAAEQEKEPFTAWGKEVGGLQAGLGLLPGAKRVYRHGETVTLVVRVRNVGKNPLAARQLNITDEYIPGFYFDWPPTVADGNGKAVVPIRVAGKGGDRNIKELTVEFGKEVELAEVKLELRPESESGDKGSNVLYGTGKFQVHYERLMYGSGKWAISSILSNLATGKLELEVKDASAEQPKALTPEEAVKIAGDSELTKKFNATKPPVEFKVEFVTKAIQVKTSGEKDAGWVHGHSPDDVCLGIVVAAEDPLRKTRFVAILTEKAIKQFNKEGINDLEKHFKGKTVRVIGLLARHDYRGRGSIPEVEIVLDDMSQIEVVK